MASATPQRPNQLDTIHKRIPIVITFLVLASALLLLAVASFQWLSPEVAREFRARGAANTSFVERIPAERGLIYDRDGEPLAFNQIEYRIGVSPNLVTDPTTVSRELALILGMDEFDIYQKIANSSQSWVPITEEGPVSAEIGQQIIDNETLLLPVTIERVANRFYPQGTLASQIVGFTIDENATGAMGVEAAYNDELAGRAIDETISTVPLYAPETGIEINQRGMDLVLTIDRELQYLVESELQSYLSQYGARSGTIIVMESRTGDILAMASSPTFDPNDPGGQNTDLLRTPAIVDAYEPGSIFKVLTVATAIEFGTVDENWSYNDTGQLNEASITVRNWDERAYGVRNATDVLVNSLNIGVATMALEMGRDAFYQGLRRFGIGELTRVDLAGEVPGQMKEPGDSDWSESDLLTNSFGQGLTVTPLQMVTAVNAIANDGLMMQPRIVSQRISGDTIQNIEPIVLRRVVLADTAHRVRDMMVHVVTDGDPAMAVIPGYSIAGKTGTAQIPNAIGYEPNTSIASFIGFFPADNPRVTVLIRLDRPTTSIWGSMTAAPAFRQLAEKLVLHLGIPEDSVRLDLASQGGQTGTLR
ncbi:penicillin-binding protein 2 [Phototrophicus methaneseepsis]|uniref:Penicillin-binding protein 2 n=1 Tax=Phototrophicus methaneseepsis TaxID=2710758 RepID=A0A7S8IDV3_9CHLR|nr:penicillin-binding protein 2 [Phototrophicus methaneseepsis]QPC81931.1 penicillin-binding protein 2 [Phototrophicus methaneseepsis]